MWKRLSLFSKVWLGLTAAVLLGLLWVGIPHFRSACLLSRGVRALTAEGNTQAAIHHLESAVQVEPGNTQAYRWLAKAYLQTGDLDKALVAADTALSLAPDNPLAELELGDVYDQRGEVEKAIPRYEPWGGEGREERLVVNYLMLADDLWNAGDREAAVAIWRDKVLGRGPADLYASWRVFRYYVHDAEEAGFYRQRLTRFAEDSIISSTDPRLANYQVEAMAGIIRGNLWSRETKLNVLAYQAWRSQSPSTGLSLQRLAELVPADADLWYYLGEYYRRQGEHQRAENAYRETIEITPEYSLAYLRLGMLSETRFTNGEDQEWLRQATTWYQQYRHLAPDDAISLHKMAALCELSQCATRTWLIQLTDYLAGRSPDFAVNQEMDDGWLFVGYDVDETRLIRGEPTALWLYWRMPDAAAPVAASDDTYQVDRRWVQLIENAQNLVLNGSFEFGAEGGSPLGFPADIYRVDPNARRLVSDLRAGQYTTVALLDNTGGCRNSSFVSTPVVVIPDGLYLQAGWVKSVGGSGYLGRQWMQGIPPEAGVDYSYVVAGVGDDDWQHYAGLAYPLQGAIGARVWLLNHDALERVYFDGILFVGIGRPW